MEIRLYTSETLDHYESFLRLSHDLSFDTSYALLPTMYTVQMSAAAVVKKQNYREKKYKRYSGTHQLLLIWKMRQRKTIN